MPLVLLNNNYRCSFSRIAFKSIVDSISTAPVAVEACIKFVDGDSSDIHKTLKIVYEMRRTNEMLYVITLINHSKKYSPIIWHMSDCVLEKKISYDKLETIINIILSRKPKVVTDSVFGDIMGDIFRISEKERNVLTLLLNGHSQTEISQLLNISVKTVSAYKNKAVERYGVRNFNELYLNWLQHSA